MKFIIYFFSILFQMQLIYSRPELFIKNESDYEIQVKVYPVGIAQAALDASVKYAKTRKQFGKSLAEFQGIQFKLADMATEIEAARMLVWRAAWAYDNQQKDFSKLSAMSKYFATDVAMKVTTDAVQVMGGEGYSKEHPVEKMMRDAKLSQIYEGTNQVNRLVVSKHVLK